MRSSSCPAGAGALLPARQVWERYGVTDRTLDRWLSRDELGFPKPVVINRRRYFYAADLTAWERSRVSAQFAAGGRHDE